MATGCPFAAFVATKSDVRPELPPDHPAIDRRHSKLSTGRLPRGSLGDTWNEYEIMCRAEHLPFLRDSSAVMQRQQLEYYGKLFVEDLTENAPSLKHLLDGRETGTLLGSIGRVPTELLRIIALPTKDLLRKDVHRLALRHIDYGAQRYHKNDFEASALSVVERIIIREGGVWTHQVENAWKWAYEYISNMLFGVIDETEPKVNAVRLSFQALLSKSAMHSSPGSSKDSRSPQANSEPPNASNEDPSGSSNNISPRGARDKSNRNGDGRSASGSRAGLKGSGIHKTTRVDKFAYELNLAEEVDPHDAALERLGNLFSGTFRESLGAKAQNYSWGIRHGHKVGKAWQLIMDNVTRPEILEQGLWRIAQRHVEIGVEVEQITYFGNSIFQVLEKWLPSEMFVEAKPSWEWLWSIVSSIFLEVIVKWKAMQVSLEASWDVLLNKAGGSSIAIAAAFYGRLFEEVPLLQPLFQRRTVTMVDTFAAALHLIINCSRDSTMFDTELEELAVRHCKYDLQAWHFDVFGQVLLASLRDLAQEAWSEDYEAAWSMLYNSIQLVFLEVIETSRSSMMHALVRNSVAAVRTSLEHAPRGDRAKRALVVRAGKRNLSPLLWSLRDGRQDIALVFLEDLFTIRADRDEYYFGMEEVWTRCPIAFAALLEFATPLVEPFLDGHLWVSRNGERGVTRVNMWIKHLYGDPSWTPNVFETPIGVLLGNVPDSLLNIMLHPVVTTTVNLKWKKFGRRRVILTTCTQAMCLFTYIVYQMFSADSYGEASQFTILILWLLPNCALLLQVLATFAKQVYRGRYTSVNITPFCTIRVPQCMTFFFIQLRFLCCVLSIAVALDELDECSRVFCRHHTQALLSAIVSFLQWIQMSEFFKLNKKLAAVFFLGREMMREFLRFMLVVAVWLFAVGGALYHLTEGYSEFSSAYDLFAAVVQFGGDNVDFSFFNSDDAFTEIVIRFLFMVCIWISVIPVFNLMVSSMVSTYTKFEEFTFALALRSRAFDVITIEDELSESTRRKHFDSVGFDNPLLFDELDKGPPGGISIFLTSRELAAHPAYERRRDKVMFFTTASGSHNPWPPHKAPALKPMKGGSNLAATRSETSTDADEDNLISSIAKDVAEIKRFLRPHHHNGRSSRVTHGEDFTNDSPSHAPRPLVSQKLPSDGTLCVVVIEGRIYDVGPYLAKHPGGRTVLEAMRGTDATAQFLSHQSIQKARVALRALHVIGEPGVREVPM